MMIRICGLLFVQVPRNSLGRCAIMDVANYYDNRVWSKTECLDNFCNTQRRCSDCRPVGYDWALVQIYM